MKDIAGYQQNTVLRRTPPSVNSLAEGQIVFALNPNKGLSMYTKRKGQLWETSFYKKSEKRVIDELEVRGNARFEKDIVSQGRISGTQVYWYSHNFNYTGTAKQYIGWNRASSSTGFEVYSKFIAPYNGRLLKVIARTESLAASTAIGFHKAADTATDPSGTATETVTVTMGADDTSYEFDFTVTSSFDKGDVLALSIDATNAINDANFTSVWLFDVTI
tara:strand:- start:31 stop:687 length:657 start_codon:yes stop_codon:yes gene_type:complete